MQRVDFFGLERPIQERFMAAARGTAPPMPLAFRRVAFPLISTLCLVVAGVCVVLLGVVARTGFGNLTSHYALQPPQALAVYAGLGALLGLCLAVVWHTQRKRSRWPFAPGVYLFPSGVVDARRLVLEVHSVRELADATAGDRFVSLSFQGGAKFRFAVTDRARADDLVQNVNGFRVQLSGDVAPTSSREFAAWDPLADNGFSNPFSPREPMKKPQGGIGLVAWLLGPLLGAALAAGAWKGRNNLAEKALYFAARKANDRVSYQAYVDRGGNNQDVRRVLLPRAELDEVVQRHSIDELEAFAKSHADSAIQVEIQGALVKELMTALEAAKAAGTLTALKQFRSRFAAHASIQVEITRAINARLQAGMNEFAKRAHPKAEVLEAFRRLLIYAGDHDGRVQVRFRRRMPDSIAKAEEVLEKSHYFGGKASVPSQYFDAKHAAQREEPVGKDIVQALSQGFAPDLLQFEVGPPIDDNSDDDPKLSEPCIVVTHRTEMSGAYLMKRPRAALTGVGILFRITFFVPGSGVAHSYKYSAWNAPDLKSMMDGRSFEEIYDEMADKAFGKIAKKYLTDLTPGLVPKADPAAVPKG